MWKTLSDNLVRNLEQYGRMTVSRNGKEEPTLRLSTLIITLAILSLNTILHLNPFSRQ